MKTWTRFVTVWLVLTVGLLAGCSSEVKIGAIVSRTGGTSPYGQSVAKGLDLALEEINAAGGVLGGPLTLIYRDDESRPDAGVAAAGSPPSRPAVAPAGAVGGVFDVEPLRLERRPAGAGRMEQGRLAGGVGDDDRGLPLGRIRPAATGRHGRLAGRRSRRGRAPGTGPLICRPHDRRARPGIRLRRRNTRLRAIGSNGVGARVAGSN